MPKTSLCGTCCRDPLNPTKCGKQQRCVCHGKDKAESKQDALQGVIIPAVQQALNIIDKSEPEPDLDVPMLFGEHKGKLISDLDTEYCRFLLSKSWLLDGTRVLLQARVARKEQEKKQ